MVTAYVSVVVMPGKEGEVAEKVINTDGIVEAAWTYGFCDILLKVKVDTMEDLNKIVFGKVRNIPGVNKTETMIVSEYLL